MDARSSPAPRSGAKVPSGLSTGIGPGDRALAELGQKMAQAAREIRDPSDSQLVCSRSRAQHAPYFRWDIRLTQRIMQMRLAPPEHLKRVPGPRALLSSLPPDPQLPAARIPLPRSSRTIWKILHATGCLLTRCKEPPHPSELRAPVEEIQLDAEGCGLRLA